MTSNQESMYGATGANRDYLGDQIELATAIPGVHFFDMRSNMVEYFGIEDNKIRGIFEFDAAIFLPKNHNYSDFIMGNWGEAVLLGAAVTIPAKHELTPFYEKAADAWLNAIKKDFAFKWINNTVTLYIDGQPASPPRFSIQEAKVAALHAAMQAQQHAELKK